MAPQVVWPQPYVHHFTGLLHDEPGSPVSDGNDPLVGANPLFPDILHQPVADLVREKDHLGALAALGLPDEGLAVFDIVGRKLQDLPDAHAPAGHELQHEPIALVRRPEDDLVNDVLFQDLGLAELLAAEHLTQSLVVAGILKFRFEGVSDEIEEGRQKREPQSLCGRFGPRGQL